MNHEIEKYDMFWLAGINSIASLSYFDKEKIFKLKYNTQGFEYYTGGIYEYISEKVIDISPDNLVSSFDWRNRHGANDPSSPYFDSDNHQVKSGWLTDVRTQGDCGSCYIFSALGAVEAKANIYYNQHDCELKQHLDLDLSEHYILSCADLGGCNGGLPSTVAFWLTYNKVLFENCDPYDSLNPGEYDCSPCIGYQYTPKVGIESLNSTNYSVYETKQHLIQTGPLPVGYNPIDHAMLLCAYTDAKAGDTLYNLNGKYKIISDTDRITGSTVWICKNSWGYGNMPFYSITAQNNPFAEITKINGPLVTENYAINIKCTDEDGDGYYWWGTSPAPCPTCPAGINQLEDCDDSNRDLGPYDGTYACTSNCDTETGTFIAPINYSVDANTRVKKDILINSGSTVTVNSILFMAPGKKITIKRGGKLYINGQGKITSSCSQLWKGIEIEGSIDNQNIVNNQGMCVINSGGVIENAICAIKTIPILNESGAIVKANGAIFTNNRTAVYFTKYSKPFDASYTKFENCTFQTSEVLSDGSTPVELVRLDDLSNPTCLSFKGCSFIQTGNQRIATGIKAFNSYFKCIKLNTDQTSFNGLLYGIYASRSTGSPVVTIDDCSFENNAKGIYLSGLTSPQVTRNTINIPPLNSGWIPLEGFTAYGLYLDASTAYKVEANDFICNTYTDQIPVYIKTCGAYIRNSGPNANELYLNTFTNLNCAVAAFGVNRNGINEGLQIKCNTFENCGTDIGVYRGTLPLTSNIGIKYDQGQYNGVGPSVSAGNSFTSLSFQHHVMDINNSAGNSLRYNHHERFSIPGNLRMIPEPLLSPNVGIFENSQSYYDPSLSCPTTLQGGLISISFLNYSADSLEEIIDSTSFVLQQNIDGGDTPGTLNLIASGSFEDTYLIYNDLMSKSPYLSDTAMSIAVKREELLPSSMLRDILVVNPQSAKSDTVFDALENRFTPLNDTLMGEIMANTEIVGAKELLETYRAEHRQHWGCLRNKVITFILSDTTEYFVDSVLVYYSNSSLLSDKYQLAFHHAANSNIEDAQAVMNTINTDQLAPDKLLEYFLNYEWINLLGNITVQDTTSILDSAQINTLFQIVSSDLNYRSLASVLARNELIKRGYINYSEPLVFNNEKKSERIRKHYPMITNNGNGIFLKVSPNPAKDFIKIQYEMPEKCNQGTIMVSTADGIKLVQIPVYSNKKETILNLKNIKNNCVIISLILCDGTKKSKILLLK
ncbi:MAG: C1 family peptidase [Chloroflexota bacterium]